MQTIRCFSHPANQTRYRTPLNAAFHACIILSFNICTYNRRVVLGLLTLVACNISAWVADMPCKIVDVIWASDPKKNMTGWWLYQIHSKFPDIEPQGPQPILFGEKWSACGDIRRERIKAWQTPWLACIWKWHLVGHVYRIILSYMQLVCGPRICAYIFLISHKSTWSVSWLAFFSFPQAYFSWALAACTLCRISY